MQNKKEVFIVGDSISLYYHKFLKKNLEGIANYYRKGSEEEIATALTPGITDEQLWKANGGTSSRVLEYLKEKVSLWLEQKQKIDVILFNCGLHDIRTMGTTAKRQVSAIKYAHNLKKIVSLIKKMQKRGLNETLFWINTTPVDNNRHNGVRNRNFRYNEDVLKYNAIAETIMKKNNVQIIDLYSLTKDILEKNNDCFRDELHYADFVSEKQAHYITEQLLPYLN